MLKTLGAVSALVMFVLGISCLLRDLRIASCHEGGLWDSSRSLCVKPRHGPCLDADCLLACKAGGCEGGALECITRQAEWICVFNCSERELCDECVRTRRRESDASLNVDVCRSGLRNVELGEYRLVEDR